MAWQYELRSGIPHNSTQLHNTSADRATVRTHPLINVQDSVTAWKRTSPVSSLR